MIHSPLAGAMFWLQKGRAAEHSVELEGCAKANAGSAPAEC